MEDAALNDKELLLSAQMGDQDAFRQLFEKYWQDLYQVARKRLSSPEDAGDVVQEVFISFYKNLAAMETAGSVAGYLYVSLRNKIFNHFEKESVRLKILLSHTTIPVQSHELIWSSLRTKELQAIIAAEIKKMPLKMRQIYLLNKEEALTIGEITELLNLSSQTVKNQLYKGLQRIRNSIRENKMDSFFLLF